MFGSTSIFTKVLTGFRKEETTGYGMDPTAILSGSDSVQVPIIGPG